VEKEIPLPVSPFVDFPFRAVHTGESIRFEAVDGTRRSRVLVYLVSICIAVVSLGGYVAIAIMLHRASNSPPWPVHALVLTIVLLIGVSTANEIRLKARLRCVALRRRGDWIELRYRWRDGKERVRTMVEPAKLLVLVRHESEKAISWHAYTGEDGVTRSKCFHDEVHVSLILQGTARSPFLPFFKSRWYGLLPSMSLYFEAFASEGNRAAALEAARPLVDSILGCLGIPVVVRVSGGPVLARFEP